MFRILVKSFSAYNLWKTYISSEFSVHLLLTELCIKMSSKDLQEQYGNADDSNQGKALSRESSQGGSKQQSKKTPNDFIFGKVIGEGSFSTVRFYINIIAEKFLLLKVHVHVYCLTLLHSKQPKLHRVVAILSAIGLKSMSILPLPAIFS